MYKVNEIISTIQGEGKYTGYPVTFVRLAGCNLQCPFCDTDHDSHVEMDVDHIIERCKHFGNLIVVFTGGEPLLQLDDKLVNAVVKENMEVHIETNGSIPLSVDGMNVQHISVSPKQPFNETFCEFADDVKILYPYLDGINPEEFVRKCRTVRIQPIMGINYTENLNGAIEECLKHGYALSVQMHKVIGVE